MMFLRSFVLLCVLLTFSHVYCQQITNHAFAYPDSNGGLSHYTDLTPVLPHRTYTLKTGADPSTCYSHALDNECTKVKSTFSAQTATYSDNPTPVTICVCQGSQFTIQTLADKVAQVPLYLRQFVKAYAAVQSSGTSAYTYDGYITVFSNNASVGTDVFIHESGHAQDNGFSGSAPWTSAIQKDTCVPDDYAGVNAVEDYAQINVIFNYNLWKKGLPAVVPPAKPGCFNNQLNAIQSSQAKGLQDYKLAVMKLPDCSYNCFFDANKGDTIRKISTNVACPKDPSKGDDYVRKVLLLNPTVTGPDVDITGHRTCLPLDCCQK